LSIHAPAFADDKLEDDAGPVVTGPAINNYDKIDIIQSGSLYPSVVKAIEDISSKLNLNTAYFGRATLGMVSITHSDGLINTLTKEGYSIPISVFTVDNDVANYFYGQEITYILKSNMAVVSEMTALRHSLVVGDSITFLTEPKGSNSLQVGLIVPDQYINWTEVLMSRDLGFEFGIYRIKKATLWTKKLDEKIFIELYKNIKTKKIQYLTKTDINKGDWILPAALLKNKFGEFSVKNRDTSSKWVIVDPEWKAINIETKSLPIIGTTTCHKLMWEPLEGALNQIQSEGLAHTLSKEEYYGNGGCYAPRRITRVNAGGALSRHTWGIAIDINTRSSYHPRVVEIFNDWGFAWGGTWTSPDAMHFELRSP
jgi:hypothetical protein